MRLAAIAIFTALLLAAAPSARAAPGDWELVYSRPAPQFRGIAMLDDSNGLATAAGGFLRTTDGGRTWAEPRPMAAYTSGPIGIAGSRTAWATGLSGGLWRTTDSGYSWEAQISGTSVHLGSVAAIGDTEAWVTGSGSGFNDIPGPADRASVLLHTTDGGATWSSVTSLLGFNYFSQIAFVGRRGWLLAADCSGEVGFAGCRTAPRALLTTDDAGATWQVPVREPAFVPAEVDWADGEHGIGTSPRSRTRVR